MRPKHLVTLLVLPAVLLAALLTLAGPAAPAHAGGIVNVCDEAHLRAALAGGGTVTFSCNGTIILTAEIVIAADTTIDGSGQIVTISGNHAVRVFYVNAGRTLDLNTLTVADGNADNGSGIYNDGMLTVNNSIISGNSASVTYPKGVGIYNNGTLTVSNSIFSGNSASTTYPNGGGIYNHGKLTVSNSTFSANSAHWGGGISNDGGTLTVIDTTFSGNYARVGGGIWSYGRVTVSNSTFGSNIAGCVGGGIDNEGGTMTVSNSTFSNNSTSNGLICGGGGINNWSTMTVSNSTFSGNSAAFGGGIYNYKTMTVSNSTFSGNSVGYGGAGDGIFNDLDGTLTLQNTIVANSCYQKGAITDGGGNLSYPYTTCPGINRDPKLGPLQDNGGPTQTMALLPGSAAIDAADDAICAAPPVNNLDQRGITRPQGAHCDIGAFEVAPHRTFLPMIVR